MNSAATLLNAFVIAGVQRGLTKVEGTAIGAISAYQKAMTDYSSKLGDRELYRRYYRDGFENGYGDGLNGN